MIVELENTFHGTTAKVATPDGRLTADQAEILHAALCCQRWCHCGADVVGAYPPRFYRGLTPAPCVPVYDGGHKGGGDHVSISWRPKRDYPWQRIATNMQDVDHARGRIETQRVLGGPFAADGEDAAYLIVINPKKETP